MRSMQFLFMVGVAGTRAAGDENTVRPVVLAHVLPRALTSTVSTVDALPRGTARIGANTFNPANDLPV